jgi:hypothetical protein
VGGEPTMTAVSGPLVTALERTWEDIRRHHPDVPPVVVAIGSGTLRERAGQVRLGHFAAGRWHAEGHELPELFVGGEGLERGANELLGTLLHEAAHGLASARGVQDTSRQGRYHSGRYRALAQELGLEVKRTGSIGWSDTTVLPETERRYRAALHRLSAAPGGIPPCRAPRRWPRQQQQRRRLGVPVPAADPGRSHRGGEGPHRVRRVQLAIRLGDE